MKFKLFCILRIKFSGYSGPKHGSDWHSGSQQPSQDSEFETKWTNSIG